MPKSRTRKPKNTRPRTATSPGEYERRRRTVDLMIDGLTPDYIAWASRGEDDLSAFATGQLLVVKMFVTIVSSLGRGAPSLRLDPDHVAGFLPPFLEDVAAAAANDDDAVDDQRYVVGTLVDWLSFLEETGRWEGTQEELEAVAEVLDSEAESLGGIVDSSPLDGAPEPTEEEAAEFAAHAPFVRHALALLEWLGEGREVLPDGGLDADALASAGAVVGSQERARRLWEAMVNAEVVELDGSVARAGEGRVDLGGTDGLGRLEAQFLGTEIVAAACTDGTPGTLEGETAAVLTAVLNAAVRQEPFTLEDVASLGDAGGAEADDEAVADGADTAAAADARGSGLEEELKGLAEQLLAEIRELEALGLVDTSDGMVAVPVAALDTVFEGIRDYDDEDAEGGEADADASREDREEASVLEEPEA